VAYVKNVKSCIAELREKKNLKAESNAGSVLPGLRAMFNQPRRGTFVMNSCTSRPACAKVKTRRCDKISPRAEIMGFQARRRVIAVYFVRGLKVHGYRHHIAPRRHCDLAQAT
jgi:hypothetical protein